MPTLFYIIDVTLDPEYNNAIIIVGNSENAIYHGESSSAYYTNMKSGYFMFSYDNFDVPKINFNDNIRRYVSHPFEAQDLTISVKKKFLKGLGSNKPLSRTFVTDNKYNFIRVLKSLPIIISKRQPRLRHITSPKFMEDYNHIFIKKVQEMIT